MVPPSVCHLIVAPPLLSSPLWLFGPNCCAPHEPPEDREAFWRPGGAPHPAARPQSTAAPHWQCPWTRRASAPPRPAFRTDGGPERRAGRRPPPSWAAESTAPTLQPIAAWKFPRRGSFRGRLAPPQAARTARGGQLPRPPSRSSFRPTLPAPARGVARLNALRYGCGPPLSHPPLPPAPCLERRPDASDPSASAPYAAARRNPGAYGFVPHSRRRRPAPGNFPGEIAPGAARVAARRAAPVFCMTQRDEGRGVNRPPGSGPRGLCPAMGDKGRHARTADASDGPPDRTAAAVEAGRRPAPRPHS